MTVTVPMTITPSCTNDSCVTHSCTKNSDNNNARSWHEARLITASNEKIYQFRPSQKLPSWSLAMKMAQPRPGSIERYNARNLDRLTDRIKKSVRKLSNSEKTLQDNWLNWSFTRSSSLTDKNGNPLRECASGSQLAPASCAAGQNIAKTRKFILTSSPFTKLRRATTVTSVMQLNDVLPFHQLPSVKSLCNVLRNWSVELDTAATDVAMQLSRTHCLHHVIEVSKFTDCIVTSTQNNTYSSSRGSCFVQYYYNAV